MAQLWFWTKIRTKEWLVLGASTFQCMRAGFLCPKCVNIACLNTLQDQNELHLKRYFFLPKSASSISRSQAHLAKRKRIAWSIGFNSWTNWTLCDVIPRSLCKIRLNDVSEMFNCWERRWIDVDSASHTLFATATIFSDVRTVFSFTRFGLSMRMPVSFTYFHKITNIRSWRCFSFSKIRIQFSHTFCNITMIFKVMSQYFTALLVRRKDKRNYLSNQIWAKCYHSRNKH